MHNEIKKSVRMDQWAAEQVSLWPELLTPELLLLTFKNWLNFNSVLCFGMIERKKRKRYLGRFGSRLVNTSGNDCWSCMCHGRNSRERKVTLDLTNFLKERCLNLFPSCFVCLSGLGLAKSRYNLIYCRICSLKRGQCCNSIPCFRRNSCESLSFYSSIFYHPIA